MSHFGPLIFLGCPYLDFNGDFGSGFLRCCGVGAKDVRSAALGVVRYFCLPAEWVYHAGVKVVKSSGSRTWIWMPLLCLSFVSL